MLGSIIRPRRWSWAAIGKHPAAKDYIRVGDTSALIEALAEWTAKGYQTLGPAKGDARGFMSWRFWLQGVKKGEILCGIGRDSSDRIGRPYPLLLVGEGTLKGWEKHWTGLPLRLGKTWQSMERIAARNFDKLSDLENALIDLRAPGPSEDKPDADTGSAGDCEGNMDQFRRQMAGDGFGMVHLNHGRHDDPEQAIRQCHRHLQAFCHQMPRAVFVGGTPQETYMAVTEHPLRKADFISLWSV